QDELPPAPTPTGRRLDRDRRDPAPPLLGPASQALPVGREPLLSHLARLGIEHGRLESVLMDVKRRVQHNGPPLVDRGPSSSAVRTEPYDIHVPGVDLGRPRAMRAG